MDLKIPKSIERAIDELRGIGGLLTAKEWERAAIVFALTHGGGRPGPKGDLVEIHPISAAELASKGIVGLTDRHTVAYYHDAWDAAVDRGDVKPATLGQTVTIPAKLPWPPNPTVARTMTAERRDALMAAGRDEGMPKGSKVADVAANPKAIRAAIISDEATAEIAAKALQDRYRQKPQREDRPRYEARRPTEDSRPDPMEALDLTTEAAERLQGALRLLSAHGRLTDDAKEAFRGYTTKIRVACDLLESVIDGGGITDQALKDLLDEGAR